MSAAQSVQAKEQASLLLCRTISKQHFDIAQPTAHQERAFITSISDKDLLLALPVGSGKSLCYQAPAQVQVGKVTFVVAPLKAIIQDQVQTLLESGIRVLALSKREDTAYDDECLRLLSRCPPIVSLVYATPDKLITEEVWCILAHLHTKKLVSRIVIDEAHFSLDPHRMQVYADLGRRLENLEDLPKTACTGTSNEATRQAIVQKFHLRDPVIILDERPRANIEYNFIGSQARGERLIQDIGQRIASQFRGQNGIVFMATKVECVAMAFVLRKLGIRAAPHHSDLPERTENFTRWRGGDLKVLCATAGVASGVDNRAVRFVIQSHLPKSLSEYDQKCGRAGRDGKPAKCNLYVRLSSIEQRAALLDRDRHDLETYFALVSSVLIKANGPCKHMVNLGELWEHLEDFFDTPGEENMEFTPLALAKALVQNKPGKTAVLQPLRLLIIYLLSIGRLRARYISNKTYCTYIEGVIWKDNAPRLDFPASPNIIEVFEVLKKMDRPARPPPSAEDRALYQTIQHPRVLKLSQYLSGKGKSIHEATLRDVQKFHQQATTVV